MEDVVVTDVHPRVGMGRLQLPDIAKILSRPVIHRSVFKTCQKSQRSKAREKILLSIVLGILRGSFSPLKSNKIDKPN